MFVTGSSVCAGMKRVFATLSIAVFWRALCVESAQHGLRIPNSMENNESHQPFETMEAPSEFLSTSPLGQDKRVFVCITGQLARLELENKFERLIMPLIEAGFHTDVGLVLSTGNAHFSHTRDLNVEDKRTIFPTVESVLNFVNRYSATSKLNVYDSIPDPRPANVYVQAIDMHPDHTTEQHHERMQNHLRMVEAYQRCWKISQMNSQSIGGESDGVNIYDAFIRVREDAGFDAPFNPKLVQNISEERKKVVATPPCRMWHGGINDRMAVVSAAAAEEYFMLPAEIIGGDPHRKLGQHQASVNYDFVTNTETFLRSMYEACDMSVRTSPKFPQVHRIHRIETNETVQDVFVSSDVEKPKCLGPEELMEHHSMAKEVVVNITYAVGL